MAHRPLDLSVLQSIKIGTDQRTRGGQGDLFDDKKIRGVVYYFMVMIVGQSVDEWLASILLRLVFCDRCQLDNNSIFHSKVNVVKNWRLIVVLDDR